MTQPAPTAIVMLSLTYRVCLRVSRAAQSHMRCATNLVNDMLQQFSSAHKRTHIQYEAPPHWHIAIAFAPYLAKAGNHLLRLSLALLFLPSWICLFFIPSLPSSPPHHHHHHSSFSIIAFHASSGWWWCSCSPWFFLSRTHWFLK